MQNILDVPFSPPSGMRAPSGNRWSHLAWVALGAWLTGLVNVWLLDVPVRVWAFGAVGIAAMAGVGGVVSMAVKR